MPFVGGEMNDENFIIIVDDDAAVRDSMAALLESADFKVQCYASAKLFLAAGHFNDACLIADIRMRR